MDEVLDLSLELAALVRVVAMVAMEVTEFAFVVGDIRLHWGQPSQVLLRLDLHQDLGRRD